MQATNKGGATNFVTYQVKAACDGTIAVNQASGATATVGPLSISSSAQVDTSIHSKLVTANNACPITTYALQDNTG